MTRRAEIFEDVYNFVVDRLAEERLDIEGSLLDDPDDQQMNTVMVRLACIEQVVGDQRHELRSAHAHWQMLGDDEWRTGYEVAERNMWNLCTWMALWWSRHPEYDPAWKPTSIRWPPVWLDWSRFE